LARIRETIITRLPLERTYGYLADFANAAEWDPGVAWAERLDPGPVAVGSRYRLGVRMAGRVAPMEYRVTQLEPNRRVVLEGSGSGVRAIDEISFAPAEGGTNVDYSADIRLTGLLRLVEPFAGGAFAAIASKAREGMQLTLDAKAGQDVPGGAEGEHGS
jgi:carbon monoxide dehydrogenase subunit G